MLSFEWRRARRSVPFIPQMEMAECGAASLAMVLAYYGRHVPLPEVRHDCGTSRDGVTALAIVEAARGHGLDAEGVRLEMAGLKELPLPAILHWGFQHFVVLERLRRNGAVLVDPASGRRIVSTEEIAQKFTGVAMIFTPGDSFEPRPETRPTLSRYRRLLRDALPRLVTVLAASLALQALALAIPIATQRIIDRVIASQDADWLWPATAILGSVVVLSALLRLLRSWMTQHLQLSMGLRLMEEFVDHLLHLPLAFFLQRTPGDLMQRVENNALLRDLFATRAVAAVLDGSFVLAYAALMLYYDPRLGALMLAWNAMRLVYLLGIRVRARQLVAAELAAAGRENGMLVEAVSTVETVKAAGAELYMVRRVMHRMTARINSAAQRQGIDIVSRLLTLALQGGALATVLWVGGRHVADGVMSVGVFAAFLALNSQLLAPLESLVSAMNQLQYLGGHLNRLDDVLKAEREMTGSIDPGRLSGAIELDRVTFAYGPKSPSILRDITLSIAAGEKVALVGATGAGKSTLAKLLLALYFPSSGSIRFDGLDLHAIDLPRLRAQMGVVLQDEFFLGGTIRDNLSLNEPNLSLARLREAATIACVDDVIERLPEAYETRIGSGGRQMSGGERQRLALARALAHRPAILLLDEATSALDRDTEARVHANLASLGVTRIVIAHRLATVVDADRVLVLNGGRIVQQGTFKELSGADGLFREFLDEMVRA